jgi:hypothetical protein
MNRREFVVRAGALAALAWSSPAAAQQQGPRHPSAERAMDLVRRARWADLSQLVCALPPQSARGLLDDIGKLVPIDQDFGALASQPMGNTIIATAHIAWAWSFRGHGVASTVTQSGIEGFERHLRAALNRLNHAITADPEDGVAHANRFTVNMGLSNKVALYEGLHAYLISTRRPVSGLATFANAISRKWLGTEPETLAFARQAYRLDLPASAALIPDVHHVCWGSRVMASPANAQPFELYLQDSTVGGEIMEASDAFNSVNPDPDSFANVWAHARLGYALLAINQIDRARPHLLGMGPYISGPWEYLPDPQAAIEAVRHRLGLETL